MSGYIGTQPVPQATQTRDSFTATSGQTSFATGGYTPNFLDVYLNGVKLASADYTATNGSDVVLASGAATGDILEVVAFTTFTPANIPSGTPSITDNGNATAITIDSSENVLVGKTTTALSTTGSYISANGLTALTTDSQRPLILNRKTNDGDLIEFNKEGSAVGSIGSSNTGERLYMANDSTGLSFIGDFSNIFPCDSGGAPRDNAINLGGVGGRFKDLYLSGGVYLGGTGSANYLDDYEEGTWTPAVVFGSGSSGITYSVRQGKYTKIGNTVQFYVQCSLSNKGSSTGNLSITGLPFTNNDTGSPHSILTGAFNNTNDVQLYLNTGSATINLENRNTGSQSPLTHSNVNNTSTIFISGVYRTTQ